MSNYVTYNIHSENYSTYTRELVADFLHKVLPIFSSHKRSRKITPKNEIVFIPDPKDITRQPYLEQPKAMLCRKLIRKIMNQHHKILNTVGYQTLLRIFQLVLLSKNAILLIFKFNFMSKSVFVVPIICIGSLEKTF